VKPSARKKDLLVGVWRAPDEWSNIEYRITRKRGAYSVAVRDFEDDERADVFETTYSAKLHELSFAAYWNSTGRFLRCRVRAGSATQLDLTFTYTEMQPLVQYTKNLHYRSKDPRP
jgi:hypothetical protein